MTTINDLAPRRYFEAVRHDLIEIVEGSGLRVLEIGCGTGATGAAMLRSGIAGEAVGIEFEPTSAAAARDVLTEVHEVDLEDFDPSVLGTFDVILIGDVLEHLLDPWKVVSELSAILRPSGQFIVSIPNVRCYAFWLPIVLRGRFDYTESGLLDRTHIRWFTRSTAIELMESANLDATVEGTRRVAEGRGSFARLVARSLGPFGVVQYLVSGRCKN